jgi:hypothetical protein
MRRYIGLVLALTLVGGGAWLLLTHAGPGQELPHRLRSIGPFLILVGALWLYADWFERM